MGDHRNRFSGDVKEALSEFELLKEKVRNVEEWTSHKDFYSLEKLIVWSAKLTHSLTTNYPVFEPTLGIHEKSFLQFLEGLRHNILENKAEQIANLRDQVVALLDDCCLIIRKEGI